VIGALAGAAFALGLLAGANKSQNRPRSIPTQRAAAKPQRTAGARYRSTPAPATGTAAAATTPPPTAEALEAHGHALMVAGEYAAAIPVLRQAVNQAQPGSLTYAYALFDLGRSLRLNGDPQAAIPILWRRLQIPIETDVVREELQLALQALGLHPPGPGDHGKHHKEPGDGGGGGGGD
jgi:tetratricopeptide (TPR) repeat protein